LEEAQQRLEQALEQLARAQSEEASREMQRAMDALRRAQREMQRGVYQGLLRDFSVAVGENAFVLAGGGRPKMGVVLGSEDWRSETDSLGVLITAVTPRGPASEAGIRTGDVFVSANGQALGRRNRRDPSPNDRLLDIMGDLEEGDTLHVVYQRDEERGEADVMVRPLDSFSYAFTPEGQWEMQEFVAPNVSVNVAPLLEGFVTPTLWLPYRWLNMELVELDPEAGQAQFGTREGLLVVRPPKDTTLALRAYDVIVSIDGRVPTDPAHAIRIMRSYEVGETMQIRVMRNRQAVTVTATVPDPRALRSRLRERRPE
jgi:S1-C subfamily serine protease